MSLIHRIGAFMQKPRMQQASGAFHEDDNAVTYAV